MYYDVRHNHRLSHHYSCSVCHDYSDYFYALTMGIALHRWDNAVDEHMHFCIHDPDHDNEIYFSITRVEAVECSNLLDLFAVRRLEALKTFARIQHEVA